MGKPNGSAADAATSVIASTFTSATTGNAILCSANRLEFNVAIWGTFVATVQLEKSYDGGTTWIVVARDTTGATASYSSPCAFSVRDIEAGNLYRLNCTAFTSGTVNYRLSY
jgi:hypothetical protein